MLLYLMKLILQELLVQVPVQVEVLALREYLKGLEVLGLW